MPQLGRLETDLTNVLLAELAPAPKAPAPSDSDDKYPLIEILRDAAFGTPAANANDDLTVTTRFHRVTKRGIAVPKVDVDSTVPYPVHSAVYEKIEKSEVIELGAPRTRKRPETTRALIARRLPEQEQPYEWIEIGVAPRTSMSMTAVTSGTFEASWFVAPDDAVDVELQAEAPSQHWMIIAGAAAIIVLLAVVALL